MTRTLTPEAQADRDDFERYAREHGGCSCHISPPCGYCSHPGNPLCQDDESCWIEERFPAIGSTVRIVKIGLPIWPDAEQFIGADCTLCAVFMTGDTQMVAVEHQAYGICCCFQAAMVRTPEQAEAERLEAEISSMIDIALVTPVITAAQARIVMERLQKAGYGKLPSQ